MSTRWYGMKVGDDTVKARDYTERDKRRHGTKGRR